MSGFVVLTDGQDITTIDRGALQQPPRFGIIGCVAPVPAPDACLYVVTDIGGVKNTIGVLRSGVGLDQLSTDRTEPGWTSLARTERTRS